MNESAGLSVCEAFPHRGYRTARHSAGDALTGCGCPRILAVVCVWCLEPVAHVKPKLRPASDCWSPRPVGDCGTLFAPLNEAGALRHSLALCLPFLPPQDPPCASQVLRTDPLIEFLFISQASAAQSSRWLVSAATHPLLFWKLVARSFWPNFPTLCSRCEKVVGDN